MNTAVLRVSCPDKKGIVASVSSFIFENKGNILHAEEHLDSEMNLFLMRVEWDLKNFSLSEAEFKKQFTKLASKFKMDWEIKYAGLLNTAVFVSSQTHCLADLLYRYKSGELNCQVKLIISNHEEARDLADFYQIPFFFIPSTDKNKAESEAMKLLKEYKIDLIVLARFMQILSPKFVRSYHNKIINIHHSFLPAFIGARPYHQAYERGVKIIGATSHYVTSDLDQGPIIEQDTVRISHKDTVADLVQKGKDLEKVVLSRAVKWHLKNRILTYSNKTVIFS